MTFPLITTASGEPFGKSVGDAVWLAADIVYRSEIKDLSDHTLSAIFADVPSTEVGAAELDRGLDLVELLARTGLAKSKGETRRLVKPGGAYVNNVRAEADITVNRTHLASGPFIVLRTGKKNYHLVRVVPA